jgi:hypothetical protein
MGLSHYDTIRDKHKDVISYLKNIQFDDENLEKGRVSRLMSLEGINDRLFCQEFMNIPEEESLVYNFLEKARQSIDIAHYKSILGKYKEFDYDEKAYLTGMLPDQWLISNDVKLNKEVDPFLLKDLLFNLTKYDEGDCSYIFAIAPKEKGFFMGAFNLENKFFIGHPTIKTLFDLSLLAHEIGHTTTSRERNLERAFIETHKSEKFEFEMDSYFYEKILFQNIAFVLDELGIVYKESNLKDTLKTMRAVKYNKHVLRLKLVTSFFNGDDPRVLNKIYEEFLDKIGISDESEDPLAGIKFAQFHNPLSSIPYLKAYEKHFKC